ncbi:hypothetical protein KCU78_g44, partial [Aureobasidium melanogenum]
LPPELSTFNLQVRVRRVDVSYWFAHSLPIVLSLSYCSQTHLKVLGVVSQCAVTLGRWNVRKCTIMQTINASGNPP